MESLRKWASVVSPILAAVIILTSAPLVPARAGIVTTDQLINLQTDASNRDRITDYLTRADVRRQMTDLGVDPADTEQRVAALSDAEARAVAAKLPAGLQGAADLVVSDVVMPEMDGPTLLKNLRAINPELKIIFVSGYAEEAFSKSLPEGQQFSFLPKPFTLKQLVGAVKETMRG